MNCWEKGVSLYFFLILVSIVNIFLMTLVYPTSSPPCSFATPIFEHYCSRPPTTNPFLLHLDLFFSLHPSRPPTPLAPPVSSHLLPRSFTTFIEKFDCICFLILSNSDIGFFKIAIFTERYFISCYFIILTRQNL